jgi:hypothetical protein
VRWGRLFFEIDNRDDADKNKICAHLAIGTGDLGEDAHYWADEMEESHGFFFSLSFTSLVSQKLGKLDVACFAFRFRWAVDL